MKSGIVTRRDPYLMDPSLMVDPNLILDYGSSFKDEVHNNSFDPLMDLINYNDTQLENIILDSGLCGECVDNPWTENEYDWDDILKGLELGLGKERREVEASQAKAAEADVSTCTINESDIANYEEVYAYDDASEESPVPSVASDVTEPESASTSDNDNESVHSYTTQTTSSTLKRKLSQDSTDTVDSEAPKRRKTTRRTKRVQDARVKNQNKVAAMKYRKKKRDEKCSLDDIVEQEEEKNRKLKSSVEELKVNIDVLKELLGKYLSPSQMKPK